MSEATTPSKTPRELGKTPRRDHRALGPDSKRYIDKRQLLQKLAMSYPSIWARMRKGVFPRPYVDGGKNYWLESEVDQYLSSLPKRTYPTTKT